MTTRLKIISINIRGFTKASLIVQELKLFGCDIAFLQETHVSSKRQVEKFERFWDGKCFWSFGVGKSAGVAIVSSSNFTGKIIHFITDSDGRVLSLLVQLDNLKFNLLNVYLPNSVSSRRSLFSCLHDYFISQGDLIIGGDFNCIDNTLDKLNCSAVIASDKKSLCSHVRLFPC